MDRTGLRYWFGIDSNLAIVVGLQSATNAIAMQIGLQATILPSIPHRRCGSRRKPFSPRFR